VKPVLAAALPAIVAAMAAPLPGQPQIPRGQELYQRACYSCHALEPGRNTPAGPTLHDIMDRPVAAQPRFNYSPALRRLAQREPRWTRALLDRFLADPAAVAPGTEMGFPGMTADQRRILLDWLRARQRRR
jgi:cytochrome c